MKMSRVPQNFMRKYRIPMTGERFTGYRGEREGGGSEGLNTQIAAKVVKFRGDKDVVGAHLLKAEYGGPDTKDNVVPWYRTAEEQFAGYEKKYPLFVRRCLMGDQKGPAQPEEWFWEFRTVVEYYQEFNDKSWTECGGFWETKRDKQMLERAKSAHNMEEVEQRVIDVTNSLLQIPRKVQVIPDGAEAAFVLEGPDITGGKVELDVTKIFDLARSVNETGEIATGGHAKPVQGPVQEGGRTAKANAYLALMRGALNDVLDHNDRLNLGASSEVREKAMARIKVAVEYADQFVTNVSEEYATGKRKAGARKPVTSRHTEWAVDNIEASTRVGEVEALWGEPGAKFWEAMRKWVLKNPLEMPRVTVWAQMARIQSASDRCLALLNNLYVVD
ncbi:hypothetical protein BUE93_21845 [Chromobacterium amazonense]|uniref:Uncharacterized protein n=1 Tax=Chromobacterium amazonense TaxID=1382803 RepID=A0A2S9WYJ5_9NEIS|nr:hypothetical protein [Chromobacterium amazonense]PRP68535.1 hypothetical protein BUE93_21845 [Chromobacterium amazonense]